MDVPCIDAHELIVTYDESDDLYIKMDIEWSEYKVLEHLLNRGFPASIRAMRVEFHGLQDHDVKRRKDRLVSQISKLGVDIEEWQ